MVKFKAILFPLSISFMLMESLQLNQDEITLDHNHIKDSSLTECLSVEGRSRDLGVCFGSEMLNRLRKYDETDTFSLTNGVSFVRDEKGQRDFGSFLDKDPMDFRGIMESTSELISRRSLQWDMGSLYPGLTMRIGPTLANGILEFVMDPRLKDRGYHGTEEPGTGRILAKQLLVPFLLGIKFHLSTLLPILLGLLLLASKKAFLLAKLAIIAVTVFGASGSFGGLTGYGTPSLTGIGAAYTTVPAQFHGHSHSDELPGYYNRHPHHSDNYYYKEKSSEDIQPVTGTPISPGELRDRLERFFVTKKEDNSKHVNEPRIDVPAGIRDARNFAWSPV